ncbi:MAG TPA: hypothetical protein VLB46_16945 [Pyrinomonadaceae bacterium]|nr:hypothetical protein [Pyrinomonadaceae bacterium]
MQIDSLKAVIGAYFVVVGFVMLIFHKGVRAFHEDWFGALSQYFPLMPRGRLITVFIILFGSLSILGGGLVFLLALPI